MNQEKLNLFLKDVERMHQEIGDENVKSHICKEFKNIKEKYIVKKEKSKKNIFEEVEKKMKSSQGETPELILIDVDEFKKPCNDDVRVERLKAVNKKLKFSENESLVVSSLKGYLLFTHKEAIGAKNFIKFLNDMNENYDYAMFLIKLYKLVKKYKNLHRCKLPVRFFKANYTIIKQICQNNSKDWE